MNDRYHPAPARATCPHCAAPVDGIPGDGAAVRAAFLHLQCPDGHAWYEVRTPDAITRHWTPAPLPVGSGG